MNSMIIRQNKTADGLRSRLFDALDGLIEGKVSTEEVSNICFISEQILNSAQLEFDIEIEREKNIRANREFDREQEILAGDKIKVLAEKMDNRDKNIIDIKDVK